MLNFLKRLFKAPDRGHPMEELARRLGMTVEQLRGARPTYREFTIPKKSGGVRRILAPDPPLKNLQKRILRRLLGRLKPHAAATGFETGYSIVSNAFGHIGRAVVVRMDLKDFFESTAAKRVTRYFSTIGWNSETCVWLTRMCTYKGGLPQGAPTSPKLSNLVNHHLDARLDRLAEKFGAVYTRYADDITFSFPSDDRDFHAVIQMTGDIATQEGYTVHRHKKLHIRRRHERQIVTGLVVNQRVNLPRRTRRWLRAVEHHAKTGQPATLTPAQLEGWRSLRRMIAKQVKEAATTSGG